MPEYLSPGVYIEERPGLKAIEGVSTSTVGFVGPAERGVVAGFPAPWTPAVTDPIPVQVPIDPAPVLVTSFAEFRRQFGNPLPIPQPTDTLDNGYLGYSVRAFFDNGGKRCYIVRVVDMTPGTALRATATLAQGAILHLTRPIRKTTAGNVVIALNSLRGINVGNTVQFFSGTSSLFGPVAVSAYDSRAGTITVPGPLTVDLQPSTTYVVNTAAPISAGTGPTFYARSPGTWSENLTIYVTPSDRPITTVPGAVPAGLTLPVRSTASMYPGAVIEIDDNNTHTYYEVANVLPGNVLQLAAATPIPALTANAGIRVVEIDVAVVDGSNAAPVELYKGLAWNPSPNLDPNHYYANQINTRSRLVYVQPPAMGGGGGNAESATVATMPTTPTGFGLTMATGVTGVTPGADGLPAVAASGDQWFVGVDNGPGQRTGIQALQDADDISIICAPGRTSQDVQEELIIQAENLRYRFAVLDGEQDPAGGAISSILSHRSLYDTSYAGYYVPWVAIQVAGVTQYVPPSGFVCGVYARTDNDRGVWKAPANEVTLGALGLKTYITTGEQDILNPRGVNAIRRFDLRGIRVWGERTLSSEPDLKYVNVRRYLIYLEKSLDRGTQWVVFEPNAPETWQRVTDAVTAFLNTQWRVGALFGRKPEDSFYVRCDETTMSVDDIQNGRLICDIGVAIVRPAEFVIFRIEQITGYAKSA